VLCTVKRVRCTTEREIQGNIEEGEREREREREGGIETKREQLRDRERDVRGRDGDCQRAEETVKGSERRGKESTGSATPVLWILVSWDRFTVRPGGIALNV